MEKQKYIKEIEKNLLCKNDKKVELCRELQSDIEAAIENGEPWEAVEKRLGAPKELAAELNESLPPKERTKQKKSPLKMTAILLTIAVIIIAAAVFIYSKLPIAKEIGSGNSFDKDAVSAQAETIIKLAGEEKWDELLEDYSDEILQTAEIKDALIAAKEVLAPWGAYQKITSEYMCAVKQGNTTMAVTQTTALFEDKSIIFTLTFNTDMKLVGIYMK